MFTSTHKLSGGTLRGRFHRHTLPSAHLGEERTVTVRLPDNYQPESRSYPVVFLQDGQNVFDSRTAFRNQEWRVDEIYSELEQKGQVPEAILVAIDHKARRSEYTDVVDPSHGGGGSQSYEKFLTEELVPAVEATYAADPSKRVMLGSSLGGYVCLTTALNNPAAFAAIGPLSPSVWWANGHLPSKVMDSPPVEGPKPRIWMDMGTEEGSSDQFGQRPVTESGFGEQPQGPNGLQDVRDRSREMALALLSKGWTLDQDLRYHEPLGAGHNEASWSARLDQVFPWLMKGL